LRIYPRLSRLAGQKPLLSKNGSNLMQNRNSCLHFTNRFWMMPFLSSAKMLHFARKSPALLGFAYRHA
jgi:hypothetical protein